MAKPDIQKLKHGQFLTKATTPTFVETWNYVTNKVENLKGDGDINGRTGFIKVDNANPEFPIIRLDINNLTSLVNGNKNATIPDSNVPAEWELGLSSIEEKYHEWLVSAYNADGDVVWQTLSATVYSLYDFDDGESIVVDKEKLSEYDIVLRHTDGDVKTVEYTALSNLNTMSCDTEILENQKSIELKTTDDDEKYIQLYDFDSEDKASIDKDNKDEYDIIVRHTDDVGNKTVEYTSMSAFTSISGDANVIDLFSIQTKDDGDDKYHQLYNFDNTGTDGKIKVTLSSGECSATYDDTITEAQFLVRNGNKLEYRTLEISSSLSGSDGGMCGNFAYDENAFTVAAGVYAKSRYFYNVGQYTVPGAGYLFLKVPLDTSGAEFVLTPNWTKSDLSNTYVPIYRFDDNKKVIADYRGAPIIPQWEYT